MRLSILLLLLLLSNLTHAHVDHEHGGSKSVLSAESVHELRDHLADALERSIRFGSTPGDGHEAALGARLVDVAYAEVVDELKRQPITARDELSRHLRSIVESLNPVSLGRWLLETGRRHGPMIAVAIGVAELTEQYGMLLAAKHPAFLFMVPLYFTHAGDVIAFSIALGAPKLVRAVKRWNRFGGLFTGPAEYYRFLLEQRQALPIDWSEVLRTAELSGGSGNALSGEFAVIREGKLVRRLPRRLRVAFVPRGLAQRESTPTVALWELEETLKASGAELRHFRPFRADPALYATVLLREIALRERASERLHERLKPAFERFGSVIRRPSAIDAEALVRATDPRELRRLGESLDLVAQRALWYLSERRERLYERVSEAARHKEITRAQARAARGRLRKLAKLLRDDRGVARMASTAHGIPPIERWEELTRHLAEARGLVALVEMELPGSRCAPLLLKK